MEENKQEKTQINTNEENTTKPVPNIENVLKKDISIGDLKASKKDKFNVNTERIKETLLNFVVPLICLGVSLLLGLAYIYPSIKNLPSLKAELSQKQLKRDTLSTKVTNLNRLIDFKTVVDENSDLINKALVSEADVPKLLDQIHQISTESGLEVSRLSYSYSSSGVNADEKTSASVAVSLGAEGNYDKIILLMENVENAARFVEVKSFRYSKSNQEGKENFLSGSFSLESPYLFVQSNAVTDDPVNLDISSSEFIGFMNTVKSLKYYEFSNQKIDVVEEAVEETAEESENVEESTENVPSGATEPVTESVPTE